MSISRYIKFNFDLVPAPKKQKLAGKDEEIYVAVQINNNKLRTQFKEIGFHSMT